MVMAEPAYASAGPIRVDRRAADRRRSAAALLAAVTSGLAAARDTVFARERFEQVLRSLVQARSIALCDDPSGVPGDDVMTFPVPGGVPHHRARIEAVFEPPRMLDGWTCQLLDTATHVAGLILEIERAQGRSLAGRNRVDGAAPLIGSSLAIRACAIESSASPRQISLFSSKERSVHSRTPISLTFLVRLPSVTAVGRWRERGRRRR